MIVVDEDLTGLTAGVWEAFLGLSCEEGPPGDVAHGISWTSSVSVSGGWNGSIALAFPAHLAAAVAGAMFGMGPDEVTDEEVGDAIGELANIIGGNIKGMVDEPCQLSLPVVAFGGNLRVRTPGTTLLSDVTLVSEGESFSVTVSEQNVRPA